MEDIYHLLGAHNQTVQEVLCQVLHWLDFQEHHVWAVLAANQRNHTARVRLVEIIAFARCMVPVDMGWLKQGSQDCLEMLRVYGESLQALLHDTALHPR